MPLTARLLFVFGLALVASSARNLNFRADGTFKILQWTDQHFYEEVVDLPSQEVQRATLLFEKPDLVVFTGDTLSGSSIPQSDAGALQAEAEWKKACQVINETQIPWAMTFGNHDDEGPLSREKLLAIDQSFPNSLSQAGPADIPGVTNYYIMVYPEGADSDSEPLAVLYFLATSDYWCEGTQSPNGCVSSAQVQWFQQLSNQINARYGKEMFSMLFFHVPVPEFVDVWNNETCVGEKNEDICCPTFNTGLYAAALKAGVRGIFSGHDHKNDYCGTFAANPTLSLCYGRKTGFGYYNPDWPMHHGARAIELSLAADGSVQWSTWIRDVFGNKIDQEPHAPTGPGQATCPNHTR